MAILKNKASREKFLIISGPFLSDKTLPMRERGLLATMHSLPENWEFTIKGMSSILPDGEAGIKSMVRSLMHRGYIAKKQSKDDGGKFGKNVIEIYETPNQETLVPPANAPLAGNPPAVIPLAENQGQYNNNKYSIKEYSTNQSINQSYTMDGQIDVEAQKKIIAENIHLDWLYEAAEGRGAAEKAMVNEIYSVICDVVCHPRDNFVIYGTKYPWATVKDQFYKLRYEHIADVLNRIVDQNLNIKNMYSYYVSVLYMASLTEFTISQASIHDDYLKFLRGKPY